MRSRYSIPPSWVCLGLLCVAGVLSMGGCASDEEVARLSPDNDRPPGHYGPSYYSRSKGERRANHIGKEAAKIGGAVIESMLGGCE